MEINGILASASASWELTSASASSTCGLVNIRANVH